MADWYAIYNTADGELRSMATVVVDPLPAGLSKKQIRVAPPFTVWDAATLDWVPRPPRPPDVDRVDEFIARVGATPTEAQLRAGLIDLLAEQRFRDDEDDYEIKSR